MEVLNLDGYTTKDFLNEFQKLYQDNNYSDEFKFSLINVCFGTDKSTPKYIPEVKNGN